MWNDENESARLCLHGRELNVMQEAGYDVCVNGSRRSGI